MRKIRIGCILLLIIATSAFTVFRVYERVNSDVVPPMILYPKEELVVSVAAKEEELLKGVTVKDDKSGDVSEYLVVESLSDFTEDGTRIITYAAIDKSGNVARRERELHYEDYTAPVFSLTGALRYPIGSQINILEKVKAESTLDGDLTSNIKYSLETAVNVRSVGKYPVEFRVMDSAGKIVYLNTELEVYDPREERIDVHLNQYIVYSDVNAGFDPNAYYAGASEAGVLTIQSSVNTAVPGIYYVDYIVQGEMAKGKTRLIVVVNEI